MLGAWKIWIALFADFSWTRSLSIRKRKKIYQRISSGNRTNSVSETIFFKMAMKRSIKILVYTIKVLIKCSENKWQATLLSYLSLFFNMSSIFFMIFTIYFFYAYSLFFIEHILKLINLMPSIKVRYNLTFLKNQYSKQTNLKEPSNLIQFDLINKENH